MALIFGPPQPDTEAARPIDLSRCAVLVPFQEKIEHDTELALAAVERLGVNVFRRPACSAIDFGRCEMASGCLIDDVEAFIFIDSDMLFHPEDVLYMLGRPEPVVGGLYSQKGFGKLNTFLDSSVKEIHVGQTGRDYHPTGIGAGFLRIRSEVLLVMIEQFGLPCCINNGQPVWPFFQPGPFKEESGQWIYLGEDYAFCRRCIQMGVQPILDTRPRLFHIGKYYYGADDAGRAAPARPQSFVINHGPPTGKPLVTFGNVDAA